MQRKNSQRVSPTQWNSSPLAQGHRAETAKKLANPAVAPPVNLINQIQFAGHPHTQTHIAPLRLFSGELPIGLVFRKG
jgi:hypothetical protein